MDKQLKFFEKDEIEWGDFKYADFYKRLFDLKHRNKGLWNGEHGGDLMKIPTGKDEMIYAFYREKEGDRVVVIINLSGEKQDFQLNSKGIVGTYNKVLGDDGKKIFLSEGMKMDMSAWEFLVLEMEQM